MEKITQTFSLDLVNISHNVINAIYGDRLTRDLYITITDKGYVYELPSDAVIRLRGHRPDGKYIFYDVEIIDGGNGLVHVEIPPFLLSCAGRAKLDIGLYKKVNGNDTEIASTESFVLYIPDHIFSEEEVVNSDNGSVLSKLIDSAEKEIEEMNKLAEDLQNKVYTKNEVDNKFSSLETNIDWKEAVATYNDIATTYPSPQDGWTVNVKDTDYTYRYNGTSWVAISANAIPKATNSVDGLLSKEDRTKYEDANSKKHTHSNKSVIDGITSTLVNNWNSAKTHAGSAHAPSNAQANVIESVKVNGTALTPSSKAVNITVPTKVSQLTNDSGFKTTDTNTWRPLGTGATDACAGNDPRLSNAREPYFANSTFYTVGDDVAIGDYDVAGTLCVKGLNGTPGIKLYDKNGNVYADVYHSKNLPAYPTSLPASDVYAWAKASTKPSYSWSEITGKPSTFTPASHSHSYLPLSGGTLTGTLSTTGNIKYNYGSHYILLTRGEAPRLLFGNGSLEYGIDNVNSKLRFYDNTNGAVIMDMAKNDVNILVNGTAFNVRGYTTGTSTVNSGTFTYYKYDDGRLVIEYQKTITADTGTGTKDSSGLYYNSINPNAYSYFPVAFTSIPRVYSDITRTTQRNPFNWISVDCVTKTYFYRILISGTNAAQACKNDTINILFIGRWK